MPPSRPEGTIRAWVYMLQCADGRFYVGSYRGHDLDVRVSEHNAGAYPDAWTYKRRPVVLMWSQEFQLITDAIAVEQQMKRWRRDKKEAVIRGEWSALKGLAMSYSRKPQGSRAASANPSQQPPSPHGEQAAKPPPVEP